MVPIGAPEESAVVIPVAALHPPGTDPPSGAGAAGGGSLGAAPGAGAAVAPSVGTGSGAGAVCPGRVGAAVAVLPGVVGRAVGEPGAVVGVLPPGVAVLVPGTVAVGEAEGVVVAAEKPASIQGLREL
jgi:hypothetical protein